MMKKLILLCTFFFFAFTVVNAKVIYVDSSNTAGTQDGLDWSTAYSNLETAYNSTTLEDGDEFWIAKGTYVNSAPLLLDKTLNFYGGFPSGGSIFSERDFVGNAIKITTNYRALFESTVNDLEIRLDGIHLFSFQYLNDARFGPLENSHWEFSNGKMSNFSFFDISQIANNSLELSNTEIFDSEGPVLFDRLDSLILVNVDFHDNSGGFIGEVNHLIFEDFDASNNTGSSFFILDSGLETFEVNNSLFKNNIFSSELFFFDSDVNSFEVINTTFSDNVFPNGYFYLDSDSEFNDLVFDGISSTNNKYSKLLEVTSVGNSLTLKNSTFDTDSVQGIFSTNQVEISLENNFFKNVYKDGPGSFIDILGGSNQTYKFINNNFEGVQFYSNLIKLIPIASGFAGYVDLEIDGMNISNCRGQTSTSLLSFDVKSYNVDNLNVLDNVVLYQSCLDLNSGEESFIQNSSFRNNFIVGPGVTGWSGNVSLYLFGKSSGFSSASSIVLDKCDFVENEYLSGQLITNDLENQTYKNCSFTNNEMGYELLKLSPTESLLFENCAFEDNNATSSVSALIQRFRKTVFKNLEVKNNIFSQAAFFVDCDSITMNNVKMEKNSTSNSMINADNDLFYCKILNSDFVENNSVSPLLQIRAQGAVANSNLLIENSVFKLNESSNAFTLIEAYSYKNREIINCEFEENNYERIFVADGGGLEDKYLQIEGSKFLNNRSDILIESQGHPVKISNSEFTAVNEEGVQKRVALFSQKTDVINSSFSGFNSINERASVIETYNEEITVTNSLFQNNTSSGVEGSVIYTDNAISLFNTVFENNSSEGSSVILTGAAGEVIGSKFLSNNSNTDILDLGGSNAVSKNNLFDSNVSNNGDIVTGRSISSIRDVFKNNFADRLVGGGSILNSLIENNTVNDRMVGQVCGFNCGGGGFSNCTVVNNKLGNSYASNSSITNSIVWGNTFFNTPVSPPTETVIFSNFQGGYPGEGNTNVNPQFVDPENGDFRLSCTSPLINKGSNEFVEQAEDLDGNTRISSDTVDIGAYEFQGDPATVDLIPVPSFSVGNTENCISDELNFVNSTANKEFFTYFWEVDGVGFSSTETDANFTFTAGGDYEVSLKATNGCGRTEETVQTITVNEAFVPSILYQTSVCPGDTVEFTTDATCSNLAWLVLNGTIQNGTEDQDTVEIVFDATGNGENAFLELLATGCNAGGVCEKPITLEIPVVPTMLELTGDTAVCELVQAWYKPTNRDFVPGVLYEWSVVNGTIISETNGYELDSVLVEWQVAGAGELRLRTYHEILDCEGGDTLNVTIRKQFNINQPNSFNRICGGSTFSFGTNLAGDFTWQVDGGTSSFNEATGEAMWLNNASEHEVVATSTSEFAFCNVKDTLVAEIIESPVIDTIVGDTLAYAGINYPYEAISTSPNISNFFINATGGFVRTRDLNKVEIEWSGSATNYSVSATARESLNNCVSSIPFVLEVKSDLDFEVLGEDTICVNSPEIYSSSLTSLDGAVYRWVHAGDTLAGTVDSPALTFEDKGPQTITMLVEYKGRSYALAKNILVESLDADFNISGASTISPEGGGAFLYTYENTDNLDLDIQVVGASSETRSLNEIEIVWESNEPYEISIQGSKIGELCVTERAVFEVEKAPEFVPVIAQSAGKLCLNDSITLSFNADEFTENVEWSINNNAVVVPESDSVAKVFWPSASGEFLVTINYERFGEKTATQSFTLSALPEPEIESVVICGEREAILKTTLAYSEYQWSLEPDGTLLNALATDTIESPGIYKVKVKDSEGCDGVGVREVLQVEFPEPKIIANANTSFCPDESTVNVSFITLENPNLNYQWSLDGQAIINETNSTYSFGFDRSVPGSFTSVGLLVTRPGCADSAFTTVSVRSSCGPGTGGGGGGGTCKDTIAAFTVSDCSPFEFIKTEGRTDVIPQWIFGDGASAFGDAVVHEYEEPGRYQVQMIVGCRVPSQTFTIPLITKFAVPENVCSKNEVEFDNSVLSLPGTNMISYVWNFGDGTPEETGSGEAPVKTIHEFENGGEYEVTLSVKAENDLGDICDYVYSQTVTVNDAPNVDFDVVFPDCENATYAFVNTGTQVTQEAQYLWNIEGVEFTSKDANFTYTDFTTEQKDVSLTVTDFIGCTADLVQTIEVKEPVEKLQIEVAGLTNICDGGSVELTAPASEDTYDWFVNDVSVNLATEKFVVTEPGIYKVRYKAPECFLFSQDLEITQFKPSATISQEGSNCLGEGLTLSLQDFTGGASVSWFKDGELLERADQVTISSAESTDAGTYLARLTEDKNPQCDFDLPSFNLIINNLPIIPVVNYSKTGVCFDSSLTVTVNNYNALHSYVVSQNGEDFSFNSADTILTNLQIDQNLTVSTIDENGCISESVERLIKVNPGVDFSLTTAEEVCRFDAFDIQSNVDATLYSFEWFRTDGTPLTESSATFSSLSASLDETGSYFSVATTNFTAPVFGCEITSDTALVIVLDGPEKPVLVGDDAFCEGEKITLNTVDNDQGSLLWSTGSTAEEIEISQGGNYVITVTNDETQCEAKSTLQVTKNPLPYVDFIGTGLYEVCGNERLEFTALSEVENFQWKLDGANYGRQNQELVPRQSGKYTVEMETAAGCADETDTLRITSVPCSKCVVITTADDIGVGSLRDAIYCANQTPGLDFITFEIPRAGTQIISIDSILPEITEGVIINGFTQSEADSYDIEISSGLYDDNLFVFGSEVEVSDVIGLTVKGFDKAFVYGLGAEQNNVSQVRFENNSVALEFDKFGRENSLSRNSFSGDTAVVFTGNTAVFLYQNDFASQTDAVHFVETNDSRIEENSFRNTTGENLILDNSSRNELSGNSFYGVASHVLELVNSSNSNTVENNNFGLTENGLVVLNGKGVKVRASNFNAFENNTFGPVGDTALSIKSSEGTVVSNNIFGRNEDGTTYAIMGPAVVVDSSAQITGNVIDKAQEYGIVAEENVSISGNSFLDNTLGGLKVTGDAVTISENTFVNEDTTVFAIELMGVANNAKAIPVFTGYNVKEGSLIIYGTSDAGDSVQLFLNDASREQALFYINATKTTTGNWSVEVPIGEFYDPLVSQYYVATATDPSGNTSQLSNNYRVCPIGVNSVPTSRDKTILGELGSSLVLEESSSSENTLVWQKENATVWVDIVDGAEGFNYLAEGLSVLLDSLNNGNYRAQYTNVCNDSLIFYSGVSRLINVTTFEPTCQEEQTLVGAVGGDTINVKLLSSGERKEGKQVSFSADSVDQVEVRWERSNILTLDIFTADTIKPVVTCVDTLKLNGRTGIEELLAPSDLILNVTENCELLDSVISKDTFRCADHGLNNVLVEVTDIHGNTGVCTSVVEIFDTNSVEIICLNSFVNYEVPDSGQTIMDVTELAEFTYAGCDEIMLELSRPLFTCADLGIQTTEAIAISSTDTASCMITVNVVNEFLPDVYNFLTIVFDSLGGADWTNKEGWEDACDLNDVENMYGVTLENGKLHTLDLSNNNLTGMVTGDLFTRLDSLKVLDLSGNILTGLGSLVSIPSLDTFNLSNTSLSVFPDLSTIPDEEEKVVVITDQFFTFADIEVYFDDSGTPLFKDLILDEVQIIDKLDTLNTIEGSDTTFDFIAPPGSFNVYQWQKWDGNSFVNTSLDQVDITLDNVARADSGLYQLVVTNERAIGLQIILQKAYIEVEEVDFCTTEASELISETVLPFCTNEAKEVIVDAPDLTIDWSLNGVNTLNTSSVTVSEEGELVVHAYDGVKCDLYDTLRLEFEVLPFEPNFLMSSEGIVGEKVVVVDVSFPVLDSASWNFGVADVEQDEESYQLTFNSVGVQEVTLVSVFGSCSLEQTKEIEILPAPGTKVFADPVNIKSMSVSPNPATDLITVEADLSKKGTANIYVVDNHGITVRQFALKKETKKIEQEISLGGLVKGVYVIQLWTNTDVKFRKVILH